MAYFGGMNGNFRVSKRLSGHRKYSCSSGPSVNRILWNLIVRCCARRWLLQCSEKAAVVEAAE